MTATVPPRYPGGTVDPRSETGRRSIRQGVQRQTRYEFIISLWRWYDIINLSDSLTRHPHDRSRRQVHIADRPHGDLDVGGVLPETGTRARRGGRPSGQRRGGQCRYPADRVGQGELQAGQDSGCLNGLYIHQSIPMAI